MASYFVDLLIKTYYAETTEEIDELCNKWREDNIIKATQTNAVYDFGKKKVVYVYTLFYLPKSDKKKPAFFAPQPGKEVVEERVETPAEKISKLPKIIVPESEAQWATCTQCARRWKWTHYRLCPSSHGLEGLPVENHARYKEIWNGDGNGKERTEHEGIDRTSKKV